MTSLSSGRDSMTPFPTARVQSLNTAPVRQDRDFVLYWMIAARRAAWSFSLDRAVDRAAELGKPLVILEALRVGYPWASDRIHRFILDGMADNARRLRNAPVLYYPYVETGHGQGRGLLEALAENACVIVTDAFPAFFLPRMTRAAAARLDIFLEQVDGNGILPLDETDRAFPTAHAFRRYLQKRLPEHLGQSPRRDPFQGVRLARMENLPHAILRRWPAASEALLKGEARALQRLPLDHSVEIVDLKGGTTQAEHLLGVFLEERIDRYSAEHNQPEAEVTSGLSPYLHFGHISAHEVVGKALEQRAWSPKRLAVKATGSRTGWWGLDEDAEAFLDQIITWRELGYTFCQHREDYDQYASLPDWARKTLEEHASDPRVHTYELEDFQMAATHDPLWNAAQGQLLREGRIHNYLRMLWGKKVLEWTPDPRRALEIMIELNNRYSLDGRDPNSYSGIFWVLGRFDRAWGPERPIFGKIRYMSSQNTARKLHVKDYVEAYAPY